MDCNVRKRKEHPLDTGGQSDPEHASENGSVDAQISEFQAAIIASFQVMGPPPAIKNYHAWLFENGFDIEVPNPTNEFVSAYYGVKPLWKTAYSQGVVVKAENDDDYFIVMECSNKNRGYKHTKIILTLGGCM